MLTSKLHYDLINLGLQRETEKLSHLTLKH